MGHAASTFELGIESKKHKGLYVGIDPPLEISWRMYRSYCLAWANLNTKYLLKIKGGKSAWLKRMNLSLNHEGPNSLAPSDSDSTFIRRYWKMIYST